MTQWTIKNSKDECTKRIEISVIFLLPQSKPINQSLEALNSPLGTPTVSKYEHDTPGKKPYSHGNIGKYP